MASATLLKALRMFKAHGPLAVLRRGSFQLVQTLRARKNLARHAPKRGVEDSVEFAFNAYGGLLKPLQVRSEIVSLLREVERLRPQTVLEIGTANGGTLFLWTRVADDAAIIVSADLPGGEHGDGYPSWKAPLYRSFAQADQSIRLVRGNSHDRSTYEQISGELGRRRVDFLFIDGDHTYAGVKQDFQMYAPLVRPGGVIALHDVADHGAGHSCQVRPFWLELKAQYEPDDSWEICEDAAQGWGGIGVVRIPATASSGT